MDSKEHRLRTCLYENHYILPSYQLYGGTAGLHDFGILGNKLKNKLIELWRDEFINETTDTIVEIDTPTIMTYQILDASGHVKRFTDFIVYNHEGESYRADHLAEDWLTNNGMKELAEQVETWDRNTLEENINKYQMIKGKFNKETNTYERVHVELKNLMFEVSSTNNAFGIDFLRPELAQGIIVNYNVCQNFLQKEPPFGIAQTGTSYRKEISPQPFIRMREFKQAEIEYFFDPKVKTHHNYEKYRETIIPIVTAEKQLNHNTVSEYMTVEYAVKNNMISSQLMAYFLARIYLFAMKIGLNKDKIRFRQHLKNEMSHYAVECWDLETFVNGKWLETIGCADRGNYDLSSHNNCINNKVFARRTLSPPMDIKTLVTKLDMKQIGPTFGDMSKHIIKHFDNLSQTELLLLSEKLDDTSVDFITIDLLEHKIEMSKKTIKVYEEVKSVTYESYVPHVLEPSFGIDRLLYSVLEQNFRTREDSRVVLSLPNVLLPYDIGIFPLSKNPEFDPLINNIINILSSKKFVCYRDNSSTSIGKKYSRADEMGIKFAITVDFDTFNDNKVTIRERDSMKQIRVRIDELISTLNELLTN